MRMRLSKSDLVFSVSIERSNACDLSIGKRMSSNDDSMTFEPATWVAAGMAFVVAGLELNPPGAAAPGAGEGRETGAALDSLLTVRADDASSQPESAVS